MINEANANAVRATGIVTSARGSFRFPVSIVDMPELGPAIEAGHVRGAIRIAKSAEGLGTWPIELAPDEEIVSHVPIAFEGMANEAEAILIAKRQALPLVKIAADDPAIAELARLLVAQTVGQ